MLSELDFLLDVARRLEEARLDYMLTGSMARSSTGPANHKANVSFPTSKSLPPTLQRAVTSHRTVIVVAA